MDLAVRVGGVDAQAGQFAKSKLPGFEFLPVASAVDVAHQLVGRVFETVVLDLDFADLEPTVPCGRTHADPSRVNSCQTLGTSGEVVLRFYL